MLQTDGRTDRQTDEIAVALTALSIASRGKNHVITVEHGNKSDDRIIQWEIPANFGYS